MDQFMLNHDWMAQQAKYWDSNNKDANNSLSVNIAFKFPILNGMTVRCVFLNKKNLVGRILTQLKKNIKWPDAL